MIPTPSLAQQWIDILKTAGPYGVILVLSVLLYYAVKEIRNKDTIIGTLYEKRIEDGRTVSNQLIAEARESTRAAVEQTAAVRGLKEQMMEVRRRG